MQTSTRKHLSKALLETMGARWFTLTYDELESDPSGFACKAFNVNNVSIDILIFNMEHSVKRGKRELLPKTAPRQQPGGPRRGHLQQTKSTRFAFRVSQVPPFDRSATKDKKRKYHTVNTTHLSPVLLNVAA